MRPVYVGSEDAVAVDPIDVVELCENDSIIVDGEDQPHLLWVEANSVPPLEVFSQGDSLGMR